MVANAHLHERMHWRSCVNPVFLVDFAFSRELSNDAHCLLTDCAFSLVGAGAAVVCAVDAGVACQGVFPIAGLGRGLTLENIKAGPETWARLKLGEKSILVDDVSAACVDENCIFFHFFKEVLVYHTLGLCSGWCMDGNDVGPAEELGQRHVLKVKLLVKTRHLRTAVDKYLHAESLSGFADKLANVSKTKDTNSSSADALAVYKHALIPLTFLE